MFVWSERRAPNTTLNNRKGYKTSVLRMAVAEVCKSTFSALLTMQLIERLSNMDLI